MKGKKFVLVSVAIVLQSQSLLQASACVTGDCVGDGGIIKITMSGFWGNTCPPGEPVVTVSGNRIDFEIWGGPPPGWVCGDMQSQWQSSGSTPILVNGEYQIFTTIHDQGSGIDYVEEQEPISLNCSTLVCHGSRWLDEPILQSDSILTSTAWEDIAADREYLVIGGSFNEIGGVSGTRHIAAWDGASFHALGNGVDFDVLALSVYRGELIAAGHSNQGGNGSLIARWDGREWRDLGVGTSGGTSPSVRALATFGNKLIAAGNFSTAGGEAVNNIASWNGKKWSSLGAGISGYVAALTSFDAQLIAGGGFSGSGAVSASNIARWDGNSWAAMGTGIEDSVSALAVLNGLPIAGGTRSCFCTAGFVRAWNGAAWTPMGGPTFQIHALKVHNGALIAGGGLLGFGYGPFAYTDRWNGSGWESFMPPCEANLGAFVHVIESYKGELFILGSDFAKRWTDTNVPWIASHPESRRASVAETVQFAVTLATGYPDLTFQWVHNNHNLSDGQCEHGPLVSGANTASLEISNLQHQDAGHYWVIVSNACGQSTSRSAKLVVATGP